MDVTTKCCVSCLFCFGNEPKLTWNGSTLNVKIPKVIHCHNGTDRMLVLKYAQPACADYKPR